MAVKRLHWPFLFLAALGLALLFTNLGSDYLWADEGDTAILASNIVKFGVPRAWDGVTFIDSDRGARLNDDLIMVSHPWVQYYLTAAAFLAFGENTFAARLPFALAGAMTILLVYIFVWRISANRWAAFGAAALTVLSVQFLLYSRQCRNYSINMLLTCGLIWIFFRMKSAWNGVLFAVAAILLFHTQPLGIVPVGVLGILTLIYRPFAPQRRWFWSALPVILIFTLPWLVLARSGYTENAEYAHSIVQFFQRLAQYTIECASVTPLIGIIILLVIWLICWRSQTRKTNGGEEPQLAPARKFLEKDEAGLFIVTFTTLFFYGLAMAMTQTCNSLWLFGLRYTPAMIPLLFMLAAILIAKISRGQIIIGSALLLIFGFTKLAQLTPWMFWNHSYPENKKEFVEAHVPVKILDSFLCPEQILFVRDLWHENPGTIGKICRFLRQFAKPDDMLITNYGWEPLYFHTRLPQALKILPSYPVNEVARRKGLPQSVFGVDHVRWVVWRLYWERYNAYRWDDVEGRIIVEGGRLTQVAELDETVWENRENIHFRRFSGGTHLYLWPKTFPPVGIFRVDWPQDTNAP